MKRIFNLSLLVLVFTLFSNVATAQSTAKTDAMAQTKALKEVAGFDKSEFKAVYAVYLKYDRKLESINKHIDSESISYMEAIDKLNVTFAKDMKKVLNDEQFAAFVKKEKLKE